MPIHICYKRILFGFCVSVFIGIVFAILSNQIAVSGSRGEFHRAIFLGVPLVGYALVWVLAFRWNSKIRVGLITSTRPWSAAVSARIRSMVIYIVAGLAASIAFIILSHPSGDLLESPTNILVWPYSILIVPLSLIKGHFGSAQAYVICIRVFIWIIISLLPWMLAWRSPLHQLCQFTHIKASSEQNKVSNTTADLQITPRSRNVILAMLAIVVLVPAALFSFAKWNKENDRDDSRELAPIPAARVVAEQQMAKDAEERKALLDAQELFSKASQQSFMLSRKIDEVSGFDQWIAMRVAGYQDCVLEIPHRTSGAPGTQGSWRVYKRDNLPFTLQKVNKETGAQWTEKVYFDVYRAVQ